MNVIEYGERSKETMFFCSFSIIWLISSFHYITPPHLNKLPYYNYMFKKMSRNIFILFNFVLFLFYPQKTCGYVDNFLHMLITILWIMWINRVFAEILGVRLWGKLLINCLYLFFQKLVLLFFHRLS